ncbi:arabinogalactan protein 14-like [Papaver somniferum]|uniref:arabinogalactan protein 14-like n=1 Tax=Papaver somniferum TaxID=3469 RepID=UPI000E6FB734|nr:arabinogalactan protein 14-like [Papaver somniferum]
MESLKMRALVAITVMVMAASSIQNNVAAADAPAPSPTSDATSFVPAVFASLTALVFGLLF